MNQNRLRLIIFALWATFFLASLAAGEVAPTILNDGSIARDDIRTLTMGVLGIFVPALSCLVGFWFPNGERTQARARSLNRARGWIAIGLTVVYLVTVLLLIVWPLYFAEYPATMNLPESESLAQRIKDALQIAMMLSPLALAPLHYMTSTTPR